MFDIQQLVLQTLQISAETVAHHRCAATQFQPRDQLGIDHHVQADWLAQGGRERLTNLGQLAIEQRTRGPKLEVLGRLSQPGPHAVRQQRQPRHQALDEATHLGTGRQPGEQLVRDVERQPGSVRIRKPPGRLLLVLQGLQRLRALFRGGYPRRFEQLIALRRRLLLHRFERCRARLR